MSRRTLLGVGLLGATGAAASVAIAIVTGMPRADLAQLSILLGVAVLATVGVTAAVARLLARSSLRIRIVAATLAGVAVALLNLAAFALLMFVSGHDAALTAILLGYTGTVGVATGTALARSSTAGITRLEETAHRLADGDLHARVDEIDAAPELRTLARTLDEMAARLEEAQRNEREAESRRRDLVAAVSHDLRTPLAGLRAMVEAVEDGVVDDPEDLRRYTREMLRAVGALTTLVDDLFELSQLDGEAIRAEVRRARLADVVASALAAVEPQRLAKGVSVELHLADAAAEPCSPRVTRVLQNLIQNAIRHTPADGSVRVEARRDADRLEIAVTDTGEGIPGSSLDRVFEPFWRGDAARSGPGSGLGLALAKRLVEAMGGDISVQSQPREGSRFAVLLPT
ncbi:MAG TPA: HAMP domain-containing sensor histidine kinase [Actinomycetota bacterium]|nr:HAMP domain-containing sensor histidine kinase [Actinomycetota bacterium]